MRQMGKQYKHMSERTACQYETIFDVVSSSRSIPQLGLKDTSCLAVPCMCNQSRGDHDIMLPPMLMPQNLVVNSLRGLTTLASSLLGSLAALLERATGSLATHGSNLLLQHCQ